MLNWSFGAFGLLIGLALAASSLRNLLALARVEKPPYPVYQGDTSDVLCNRQGWASAFMMLVGLFIAAAAAGELMG